MIDASKLGNVENEAGTSELTLLVGIEGGSVEGAAEHLETVEVGRVELLEGTN